MTLSIELLRKFAVKKKSATLEEVVYKIEKLVVESKMLYLPQRIMKRKKNQHHSLDEFKLSIPKPK